MNEPTIKTIGDSILIDDLLLENKILRKENKRLRQRIKEMEEIISLKI